MLENFRQKINKAVVAGAMLSGLSGQAEAREAKDVTPLTGEAQAGQSPEDKIRADYLAGKWVDASIGSTKSLKEDVEAEYINKKYMLGVMKPEFFLGKGIVVTGGSINGFVTKDKNGKVVFLDMLKLGNPEQPTDSSEFQDFVKSILGSDLPDSVKEPFRELLIAK